MAEIRNCPSCGEFFNYTGVRDVCYKCAQREEDMYQIVYRFLRKRENRAATVDRIVEATGVEEEVLYKWVRKGRLHPAVFPNLGYPCDNCGKITNKGKLCQDCQDDLKSELRTFEAAQEFREDIKRREKGTYLAEQKD
ncbi:membrane protein [Ureibacillus massiliensis 4400831 = CIP 108448 = CCUG 49529]|uniref:Membrane protein n=1 Tax=Ureibacillus massiliensis 4400831 = CIP 108448 = CCUG 49529 TaxID=1211035 RepID=A0A0A3IZ77_9BACL|nr:TIGR03826 family flagellar region protein [Ureibacillus massiliensis]KGR90079.1 membrane protein [Ureibacillus massiliensis 4400831 = CIP 108448 = CCUG 49529]